MATGDILTASINSNGRELVLKIEGQGVGGTYDFGLGANNSTINAKVKISVTEPGFTNTGAITTVQRVIYATKEYRKPYPLEATNQEIVSGADVVITVPLSEFIGADASLLTVDVLAAFYTDTIGNNAVTSLPVTNNSIEGYGKVVANWSRMGHNLITDSLQLSITSFHRTALLGEIVKAVKFTVTDETLNIITKIITTPTATIEPKTGLCIIEYICDFNGTELSALTAEEMLSCDFKVYPIIGNAASIQDSSDGVNTATDWRYKTQLNYYDPLEVYTKAYAIVDPIGGDDATGVASPDFATADASRFAHIFQAILKIKDYNRYDTISRQNASNGVVYLVAGEHDFAGGAASTTTDGQEKVWMDILPYPGESKSTVYGVPNTASSGNRYLESKYVRVRDISFSRSTGAYWFRSKISNSVLLVEDCTIDCSGFDYPYWNYGFIASNLINNTLTSTASMTLHASLMRGNLCTGAAETGYGTNIIGNRFLCNESEESNLISESTDPLNLADGCVIAFNKFMGQNNTVIRFGSQTWTHGLAIIQNVIERSVLGSGSYTACTIYANEATQINASLTNFIRWNNTVTGQRENMGYLGVGTGDVLMDFSNWSERGNISEYRAYKADLFPPQDGTRIQNWGIGFQVGGEGNLMKDDSFTVEFAGKNSIIKTTPVFGFVDDASIEGSGLGNGDYHITELSDAIGIGYTSPLPYDLEGVTRIVDGASGAYEYVVQEAQLNNLVQGITILQSATAEYRTFDPSNLTQGSVIIGIPVASGEPTIELDNIIQGAIIIQSTTAYGENDNIYYKTLSINGEIITSISINGSIT